MGDGFSDFTEGLHDLYDLFPLKHSEDHLETAKS
jgi:hypothetical protein